MLLTVGGRLRLDKRAGGASGFIPLPPASLPQSHRCPGPSAQPTPGCVHTATGRRPQMSRKIIPRKHLRDKGIRWSKATLWRKIRDGVFLQPLKGLGKEDGFFEDE